MNSTSQFLSYEKALQTISCDAVDVRPLKISEIWTAANTWSRAMVGDPYLEYQAGDRRPTPRRIWRLAYAGMLALWIGDVPIFTAEGGASLSLNYNPPSVPKSRLARIKHKLALKLYEAADGKKTKEQQKRWNECQAKEAATFAAIPAEEAKEMYIIGQMATDPRYQGRGLGSAVLQAMTTLADKEQRACWLMSSNAANDAFYNSNGFFTVAKFTVGEDNPSWNKKPVVVQFMVREPEGGRKVFEETCSSPSPSSMVTKGNKPRVPLQFQF